MFKVLHAYKEMFLISLSVSLSLCTWYFQCLLSAASWVFLLMTTSVCLPSALLSALEGPPASFLS